MSSNEVTLAIRFSQSGGKTIATLSGHDWRTLSLAIEAADPQTAAAELVKAYFVLNPASFKPFPQEAPLSPNLASHQAVTPTAIETMLRDAITAGARVYLSRYRKLDGTVAEPRWIRPERIYRGVNGKRVLSAYDELREETRSFRLDRIDILVSPA